MNDPPADHHRVPVVLVVDDEDLVREMSGRTLQRAGYQVVEASDGARALGILMQGGVDAVVTDIRMPGMDGWELAGRLAMMTPRPPILFMSGYDIHSGSTNFAGPFLAKPFRSEQLVASVRRLLAGANCPDRRAERSG
jgi:CheY-like chemotaxis protein